ncbi:MAG: VanZ family protein [Bacteroidales bacterium]|jgi:VanZ family protein|nr:VanZ family protein [Bacteroidales bacterium]MDD4703736.1 VanZ family protein [Bacteroidales bacterium]
MWKKLNIVFFVLWVALMFFAILAPSESLPKGIGFFSFIPYFDKIVHAIMFGGFAFLLFGLFYPSKKLNYSVIATLIISILFAVFTELMQFLLGEYIHRSLEFWDVVADILGVVLAIGICVLIVRRIQDAQ